MTKSPKITSIGGGSGTYNVLMGLKQFSKKLSAVVAMTDSGGSAGRIRDEFGILPPGDVRRALLALSDSSLHLRSLFEYRFEKGNSLSGYSFGNLFLAALTDITGSEEKAIKAAGKILNITGQVIPITLSDCHLCARLEDGSIIKGETNIDIRRVRPDLKILDVFLDNSALINPRAQQAIEEADLVVIGPGDLYTSLIVNLLVEGVADAIHNARGQVIYVTNIMNKHGETDNFTAFDFVSQIQAYLKNADDLDHAIINQSKFPEKLLKKYAEENAFPVDPDLAKVKSIIKNVIHADLTRPNILLRHDANKLAQVILSVWDNRKI